MTTLSPAAVTAAAAALGNAAVGVLQVGEAQVALPLDVLREVFPRPQRFSALPASALGLLGAVTLRGKVLPVVDLRLVLGVPAPLHDGQVVAVLRHGGAELGLLADGVCGLTRLDAGQSDRMACDGGPLLFSGSFERSEDQSVVSLLDPQAVMRLPGLPRTQQRLEDDGPPPARLAERVPLMLVRCGQIRLAIGVTDIHTTLPRVTLHPSSMDGVICRGVIDHAGLAVPAVDALALMQLGSLPPGEPCEALLLKLPAGLVALLVSQVIDIALVQPSDLLPLPPLAVQRPALFQATLRVAEQGDHLVLGAGALLRDAELASYASLNTRMQGAAGTATAPSAGLGAAAVAAASGHAVLTYDIGTEVATRLTQVSEVLPPPANRARPASGHPAVVGLFTHRGQAVSLVCLSTLLHGDAATAAAPEADTAQVLLVAHGKVQFGFLVRRLCHIDETVWEAPRNAANSGGRAALGPHAVVELGHGAQRRAVQLIDLHALAGSLLDWAGATPSTAEAVPAAREAALPA